MSRLIRLLAKSSWLTNPFYAPRAYHRPRRGESRADFVRIAGDMRQVGFDLRKVADRELGKYVR